MTCSMVYAKRKSIGRSYARRKRTKHELFECKYRRGKRKSAMNDFLIRKLFTNIFGEWL